MKNISKKDLLIFIIIFLIGLTICYPLIIQMHFAPDTYQVVVLGYTEYAKQYFLRSGRIVTALSFFLADNLNISYKTYIIFMEILAIFSQALSTMLLYKLLLRKIEIDNKIKEYLLLMASFLIIFNMFALEFLLYAESGIICLSILFSILGLKTFLEGSRFRYLKSMLLVVIATILYQGNVNIFFILVVMFNFIIKDNKEKINYKKIFKEIFLSGTILIIAFIVTAILIFLSTNIINLEQERFSTDYRNINIVNIIQSFISTSLYILLYGFNFLHKYVLIAVILIMIEHSALKTKNSDIIKYLFTVFMALCVCILPIYTMASAFISARMCMSIGAIVGITFVYIITNTNYKNKIEKNLVMIITVLAVLYTSYNYVIISQSNIEENKVDNEVGYKIKNMVENYEKENNIEINKVSVFSDTNRSFYTSEKIKNTFTERSTANYYCIKEVLEYYLDKKIEIVDIDEQIYTNNYKNKNWDSFSEEQITFKEDVMYMCIY